MLTRLFSSLGVLTLATAAAADVTARPSVQTIASNRSGHFTTTLISRDPFVVGRGQFCTELTDFGCAAGSVLATVSAPFRAVDAPEMCGGELCSDAPRYPQQTRFRDRVRVPADVARVAQTQTVFFVRDHSTWSSPEFSAVRLRVANNPAGGALSIEDIDVYIMTDAGRMQGLLRLGRDATPATRVMADLTTRGSGRISGRWVVNTPAGSVTLDHFSLRANSRGRVRIIGPKIQDLPQTLAGRHVIELQFDRLIASRETDSDEVTYFAEGGRLPVLRLSLSSTTIRWRPADIPSAAGLRFEGPGMQYPVIVPFSTGKTERPEGAQRTWAVDSDGYAVSKAIELE